MAAEFFGTIIIMPFVIWLIYAVLDGIGWITVDQFFFSRDRW